MPPSDDDFKALQARVKVLETQKVPTSRLPMIQLRRALAREPQNAGDILLPHSVSPEQLKGIVGWQALPLTAFWKAYESSVFALPEFKKSVDNLVTVRGLIQPAAVGQNQIAQLPAGFRPPIVATTHAQQGFACAGSFTPGNAFVRVDVASDGRIIPEASFAGTTTNFYLFLDTIQFYTE